LTQTGTTEFVARVERRMAALLAPDERAVRERNVLAAASHHLCLGNGGKRVRPRLVALLGRALGAEEQGLEEVAAAGELIHGASLLHDDVVDEAPRRRGRATVNAGWGNQVAVLAGDWLLSSAFSLLRPHPREVTSEAIEVVAEMSRAAIAELEARADCRLSLERWRAIAEGKTGALFGWCGRAAARLGGGQARVEAFDRFGRRLGIAFQIADDLKDLGGLAEGKDPLADLRNRNPSVPILLAASRSEDFCRGLEALWREEDLRPEALERLGAQLLETGAAVETAALLERETEAAIGELGELGGLPWCAELLGLVRSFGRSPGAA